jgi:SAM-dependent methyltransferase
VLRLADVQPVRSGGPAALLVLAARSGRSRRPAVVALLAWWGWVWVLYRRDGARETTGELERMRTVDAASFRRHYDEQVPTVEEEFALWGAYHQHRHELRYDLVARAVRADVPAGGRVLDIGCGSALVADLLADLPLVYVGTDLAHHHLAFALGKERPRDLRLSRSVAAAAAEQLPFADASFDVVVMSEVIEHLIRPELAVREVARVLRPAACS